MGVDIGAGHLPGWETSRPSRLLRPRRRMETMSFCRMGNEQLGRSFVFSFFNHRFVLSSSLLQCSSYHVYIVVHMHNFSYFGMR